MRQTRCNPATSRGNRAAAYEPAACACASEKQRARELDYGPNGELYKSVEEHIRDAQRINALADKFLLQTASGAVLGAEQFCKTRK